ncbi:MAG: diacylglyceryl transferase [Flavobacteriaceae bacterium]|nr:diacylglyceryl transferase [Flavobacteriaceae bacterium]
MNKLKQRWGITSNLDLFLIFVVFSINGSFATFIAKPLMSFIGLSKETTSGWVFWPIRILLIFVVYQITLPIVGFCFGQKKFFWNFSKKMLRRLRIIK